MGVYTSPAQLMAAQDRRFKNTVHAQEEVHVELAKDGKSDLKDATSGKLSEDELSGWHPYAKRDNLSNARREKGLAVASVNRGVKHNRRRQVTLGKVLTIVGQVNRAIANPYPINKQTGALQRGIFLRKQGAHTFDLGSTAPHSAQQFSPTGTEIMVSRQVMGNRDNGGKDGVLRVRFRARVQGYIKMVRDIQKKP